MQQYSGGDPERSGKRKSFGKRKLPDSEDASQSQSQRTISDLLSKNPPQNTPSQSFPETSKRSRLSASPSRSASSHTVSPNKMYNLSGSPPKNGATLGRSASGLGAPPVKSQTFNANMRQNNFSPHAGARKLVVKNLRTGPRANQEPYFDKTWKQLDAALSAIFDGKKPETSLEELYKGAENICRQERAASLAKRVQDRCEGYVAGVLRNNLVTRAGGGNNIDTLRAVIDAWSSWHSRLVTVRWIFYYLDQSFLLHSKEYPTIQGMGLLQFRSYIVADSSLKPIIFQGACDLIKADRGAEASGLPDPTLLRAAMELFHNLDVYNSDFEPLFIAETDDYLQSWARQEASLPLASFVENIHQLIEREVERCRLFSLNQSTRLKLSELLDQHLVEEQKDKLLSRDEVVGLLRANKNTTLKQLYGLLSRRDLAGRLSNVFHSFIVEEGLSIVFDEGHESEMVVRLLQFKQQLDDIWIHAFDRNEELDDCSRSAFAKFMNLGKKTEATGHTDNPIAGEMIAKHVDRLLKGGWKVPAAGQHEATMADEDIEIDRQLDQVLDLFRFVQGKLVFEAFYKKDLARRLLMGRSASDDAEKRMLDRLKNECGASFTHNLESMFKDMEVARDEMAAYNALKDERDRQSRPPVDLSVSVLSAAAWPDYGDVEVIIPPNVAASISDFENFYHSKYNGRKLKWQHQLAHCQLRARFPKDTKELVVSAFQAIVMLLFNDVADGESLDYKQIQQLTGLSDPELQRTLQSLACAKYRVLTKNPKGKEVNPTDTFTYNAGFTDAKKRIKINQIQLKETKEENTKTHERVAADRHFETQAAIVRIMKSRKTIKHAALIAEVMEATKARGTLQPDQIKANIERLMEKDYMERVEGSNSYRYVA